MENNIIKPITLKIDKNLWEEFKLFVPSSISLNMAIIKLIENAIENDAADIIKKEVKVHGR